MGNIQQHDGIRPRPDHHNNQRTPRTTTYYCTEVEIRRGRLECLPRLHQRPDRRRRRPAEQQDRRYYQIGSGAKYSTDETIGPGRQKPLTYWNDDIKMAIRNRNRARRKMHRTRNINDCIEYRRLKSIAQRVIRSAARGYWQNFCDRLTNQSRLTAVWNMAKKMNRTKSNPTSTSLVDNESVVEIDKGKAEVFARAFANVSSIRCGQQCFCLFENWTVCLSELFVEMFRYFCDWSVVCEQICVVLFDVVLVSLVLRAVITTNCNKLRRGVPETQERHRTEPHGK